jgi:hypothetical protein
VDLLLRPFFSKRSLQFQLTDGRLTSYLDKLGHVVAVRSVAVEDSKQQAPMLRIRHAYQFLLYRVKGYWPRTKYTGSHLPVLYLVQDDASSICKLSISTS